MAKYIADQEGNFIAVDGRLITAPEGSGTDISLEISGASAGQILQIQDVSSDGVPLKWNAVAIDTLVEDAETDPTVPEYVKNISEEDIASWNNKSDFDGNYSSLTGAPDIPTKISELTNDSGFITTSDIPEGAAASTTSPKMDGTATIGTELAFARGDHIHPSDTSKVDKVEGKGLSTNDYTDEEKNKLASIAEGATVVNESTVSGWGFSKTTGTYSKPDDGIPATDLSSSVQTSLGKADTALQSFTEADPTVPSHVKSISTDDIASWNAKAEISDIPTVPSSGYLVRITYSSTPASEIQAILDAGNTPYIIYNNNTYYYQDISPDNYYRFVSVTPGSTAANDPPIIKRIYKKVGSESGNWGNGTTTLYDQNHKPTASDVGALPSTTAIPSALSDLTDDATHRVVTDTEKAEWSGKQDAISNLSIIVNGAAAGVTALQPNDIADWAKAASKPTYTAAEVGALPSDTKFISEVTTSNITSALGYTPVDAAKLGAANGIAQLDTTGKVPAAQLPSYVDDVLEYNGKANFPTTGESGIIYIDSATNITYRWGGSDYVAIGSDLALGETSSTAYAGDKGKANADAISSHTADTTIHTSTTEKIHGTQNIINQKVAFQNQIQLKLFKLLLVWQIAPYRALQRVTQQCLHM